MSIQHSKLPILGAVAAAIGASLCCAGPLVLLLLGVSGSWIASLAIFEPLKPYFIVVTALLFLWVGWGLYKPQSNCQAGSACAVPRVIKEALIKSLELLRDFKEADSRRALQAMASPCQKAQQRSCPLKPRPKGSKPNVQPLRYLFLPYRHTPAKRCLDSEHLACPEAKGFNQRFLKNRRRLFWVALGIATILVSSSWWIPLLPESWLY